MAIVKANGYGHGLQETAKIVQEAGAEWFGVSRFEEALALREAGLQGDILVLGYTPPVNIPEAIRNNISLNAYHYEIADAYSQIACQEKSALKVHAKIDTGLGRLGILPDEAPGFIVHLKNLPGLDLEGVFTHFAVADEPARPDTASQIRAFKKVVDEITKEGLRPPLVHACNSAATINFPEARFDMVRCGIAMYGLKSERNMNLPEGFVPAMTWKTRIASIKQLPQGHGVSYGLNYHTSQIEKIGAIPVGYGDGLRRQNGYQVLVHGQRVNVIGNVCMDQCMLQLDGIRDAAIGDEVVVIGNQGDQTITALDLAEAWHTITNELVCGMAKRLPRIYI